MKGEFIIAVHGLTYLNHKQCLVSSAELADNICTPSARVRKVMLSLKKYGLVNTIPGAKGGYTIAKPASKITLADCMKAIDDVAVSVNWISGDMDKACMISSGMHLVMDDIQDRLNLLCLQELDKLTIADIDKKIFKGGNL